MRTSIIASELCSIMPMRMCAVRSPTSMPEWRRCVTFGCRNDGAWPSLIAMRETSSGMRDPRRASRWCVWTSSSSVIVKIAESPGCAAKARSSCSSSSSIDRDADDLRLVERERALRVGATKAVEPLRADALALVAEDADDARVAAIHEIAAPLRGPPASSSIVIVVYLVGVDRPVEQDDGNAALVQDVEVLEVAVSDESTRRTPSAERCVQYSTSRRSWTMELSDWKTISE